MTKNKKQLNSRNLPSSFISICKPSVHFSFLSSLFPPFLYTHLTSINHNGKPVIFFIFPPGVWYGRSCAFLGASAYHHRHPPPSPHIPSFSPLSLDFLFLYASIILIPGTLSHSLFLYVYDLNDSDRGIFLLNFLLLENDFIIYCNSRVFLLILASSFFSMPTCFNLITWLGLSEIFSFRVFNCWEICWNWKEI